MRMSTKHEGAAAPELPVIRPNRSVWVLPDGRVVDAESEGATEDGGAFSHGIYVKKWIAFRLGRFCPDRAEHEAASRMKARALELLAEHPDLSEQDDESFPNPYEGDLAYNHAAEEEGWIRIKPMTVPSNDTIYAETMTGSMSPAARSAIEGAARANGWRLVVLSGGALANRAKDLGGDSSDRT